MKSDNTSTKIRVMLVDDHMVVRMGLSFAIGNQPDMEVVAQAVDGVEACDLYRTHRPDVVVLDLRMPKRNGVETIGALRREGALQGKEAWDDYVAFSAKGETKAIIKAMTLRCKGRKVKVATRPMDKGEAAACCKQQKALNLVYVK